MKRLTGLLNFLAIVSMSCIMTVALSDSANSAGKYKHPEPQEWGFNGLFGKFDKSSIRRGLQVYLEVCSSCHGLNQVAYRNLKDIGLTIEEIKEISAQFEVMDGPDNEGEMFTREARPSDKFVAPFENEKAARVSNNGAMPPDLSLITKSRHGGADYIYALLTGYKDEAPDGVEMGDGMNFNPYFVGQQIAMSQPLYEDSVEYSDGTKATVSQMSWDLVNFLHWTAEPEMEQRRGLGGKVVLFLLVLTALLYAVKRQVWSKEH